MERVKLQAEVLVPLLRHLRAELGEAEANALVYPILRARMRAWISEIAIHDSGDPIEDWKRTSDKLEALFEGDVEWTILKQTPNKLDLDVTGCRFADFFRQIGEPDLGTILTCELDNHIAALSSSAVTLTRAKTIMMGAKSCPFRYQFGSGSTSD
jgi:hypothetical protein